MVFPKARIVYTGLVDSALLLKSKFMFSDEFIKKAKEMVDNNTQIIGLYFSLPEKDREQFRERFERIVNNSHNLISKTFNNEKAS